MASSNGHYYVPNPSPWPIITSAGLFLLAFGFVLLMNNLGAGPWFMIGGGAIIIYMMFRWFGDVVSESESGLYDARVDRSFRWGMSWFIFSEVMFFAAFFGTLFYVRMFVGPWIAENELLWPNFDFAWPSAGPKGPLAIEADSLPGPNQFSPMGAWGIPAINTLLLLTSGAWLTWAHWGLLKNNRAQLITGLFLTVAFGIAFMILQAYEYAHAYMELGLTLKTGIYGATFYMLTGFHGLHVMMGTIMLIVMLARSIKGHFRPDNHFAFEAAAWYWHFVDVVWLGLFVFVYWL